MPIVTTGGSPYPTVAEVMNLSRVRINDAAQGLDGDLLSNTQPYTLTILNAAWRSLQTKVSNKGIETLIKEWNITDFPASVDTTQQSWIGWTGSGAGGLEFDSPQLPQDFILPSNVWMDYGDGYLQSMDQATQGLPNLQEGGVYDWRGDGLYFYGTTQPVNLRIRYTAFLPALDFNDPNAQVPMMFCQDALSWRIVLEFANSRGSSQAASIAAMYEEAVSEIAERTGRKNQRRSLRRQGFSRKDDFYNPWPIIR